MYAKRKNEYPISNTQYPMSKEKKEKGNDRSIIFSNLNRRKNTNKGAVFT